MPKTSLILIVALAGFVVYMLSWPVSVDPASWKAPETLGFTGSFAPNNHLLGVERLELIDGRGPEDVAINRKGEIFAGLEDGRIVQYMALTGLWEKVIDTKGRPLGLHFDQDDNLIICDSLRGLLMVSPTRKITVLSTESEGIPFGFPDDLDIAADGKIYFTDASFKFSIHNYHQDALEHRPNGRLLVYDPETQETKTLLRDLFFPNGVAVSSDQAFLLVNESWKYRVLKLGLTGEAAGKIDVFIDNLPGIPDGISSNKKGIFWVALVSPRSSIIDFSANKPFLRKLIARLPQFMQPDEEPYASIIGLNQKGEIAYNLQDPQAKKYSLVSSVEEYRGTLYLGSLRENAVGRFQLKNL